MANFSFSLHPGKHPLITADLNSFIKKTAIFFLGLLVLGLGTDYLLKTGLRQRTTFVYGVWNQILEGKVNAEILVAGSSRALVFFHPTIIDSLSGYNSYNIGLDGHPLYLQYHRLQAYFRTNEKPKLVVQELGLNTLGMPDGVYYPEQYTPYLSEPEIYKNLVTVEPTLWKSKYIPMYDFFRFKKELAGVSVKGLLGLEDPAKDPLIKGYYPRHWEWMTHFDQFKKLYPEGREYPLDSAGVACLENIISLCRENEVPLVLVYPPEYYENFPYSLNREEIMDTFVRIAAENEIPYWDYTHSAMSYNQDLFYNSQHMNDRGARAFSRDLAPRLKQFLEGEKQLFLEFSPPAGLPNNN